MAQARLWQGPVVDAHHHFWDPTKHYYPWLEPGMQVAHRYGEYEAIKRRYHPADFRQDTRGHHVVESVYVEAEWNPNDPIGETRYIHDLATHHAYPNAMVAQAWLHHDDAALVLAQQAEFALVRSVRHKPGGPVRLEDVGRERTLMSDERWRRGYAELARHGLHFDLQTPWWNLPEAVQLTRDFPATTLILNHAGLPGDRSPRGLSSWRKAMAALAEQANVAVKISGLGLRGRPWSIEDNGPIVRDIITMFGPTRVMFASNFPVDGLCATFDTIFTGFKRIVASLPVTDQEALFCATARRIYRTQPPIAKDRSVLQG